MWVWIIYIYNSDVYKFSWLVIASVFYTQKYLVKQQTETTEAKIAWQCPWYNTERKINDLMNSFISRYGLETKPLRFWWENMVDVTEGVSN